MPVIGRLDGQVEEVLIKPVGERVRADEETGGPDTAAPERPAQTADESERAAREDEPARRPGALPVWML